MKIEMADWLRRSTRRSVAVIGLATAALLGGALGAIQLANAAGTSSVFVPVSPWRILETRAAQGAHPAGAHTLAAGEVYTLQVTGNVAGCPTPADCVPTGAQAVVLNLTVTNPTATSYLTLWPSDEGQPTASNLNWVALRTIANLVTVKLSAGGAVNMYNNVGVVDVIADVQGWYEGGGGGAPGPSGPSGPAGTPGSSGGSGPSGPIGPGGSGSLGPSGPSGPAGTNGESVLNGAANPGFGTGSTGDFWINTSAHTIFGPRSGLGFWGSGTSLIGPSGPSGPTGGSGTAGTSGLSGPSGPSGGSGTNGTNGVSGYEQHTQTTVAATMTAACTAGKKVVGGGVTGVSGATVLESYPDETGAGLQDAWSVLFSGAPGAATVYAICVTAS